MVYILHCIVYLYWLLVLETELATGLYFLCHTLRVDIVTPGACCIYTVILLKSVSVRKLQVAILARLSREVSLTVRIVWQHIMSRVRVSVRPGNFFIPEKQSNKLRIQRLVRDCLSGWNTERALFTGQGRSIASDNVRERRKRRS